MRKRARRASIYQMGIDKKRRMQEYMHVSSHHIGHQIHSMQNDPYTQDIIFSSWLNTNFSKEKSPTQLMVECSLSLNMGGCFPRLSTFDFIIKFLNVFLPYTLIIFIPYVWVFKYVFRSVIVNEFDEPSKWLWKRDEFNLFKEWFWIRNVRRVGMITVIKKKKRLTYGHIYLISFC